jgi:signal transduction histidine kinase/ActR/RegA family two-component response regulator
LQEIVNTAGPDLAVIFLRNGDGLVLKGVFPEQREIGWEPLAAHKVRACLCGLAVSEDQAIFSPDINADPRCSLEECRLAGFRSFAALPLRSGAEIIGVLGMASRQPQDFQEHAAFLEALANEMSTGLKKSLLYEQVQQHALKLEESLARIEEAEAERLQLLQHLQRSQKMEAMGTLASGIAHDFNNILAAIIGYAELALMDTPETAKSQKSLEMVLAAGNRAKDLVKQILAFSRQSEEQRKPVQITHTLKEVLILMRASLPATIEIRENLGAGVGNILADPVNIHQVLLNLCTNAHHAMRDQGGVLEVQLSGVNLGPEGAAVHPDLTPGPYVKLAVKDNGCGMDEATKVKIFDPYFTTKEKGVGTGLGLAVAHSIVKKHGGAITVDSVPGQGSEFTLYFPAIQQEEAWEAPVAASLPTGREHILLVDDEQALADMGREMLEYLGYQVDTRMSSIDALALFRDQPQRYDLVITDLTMPNMTGDQLAQELMRIRPDLPIMLCTGYGESILEEKARAMGIKAFIMKPILISQMARAIRQALGKPGAKPSPVMSG